MVPFCFCAFTVYVMFLLYQFCCQFVWQALYVCHHSLSIPLRIVAIAPKELEVHPHLLSILSASVDYVAWTTLARVRELSLLQHILE